MLSNKIEIKENSINQTSVKIYKKLGFIVALLGFLLYSNTLNHTYVLDDFSLISENTVTTKGIQSIPTIFKTHYRYGYYNLDDGIYRPLSVAMFAAEWEISKNNPVLSHWVNVIFYALTGWLLFITLFKLMKGYNIVVPFIISILFIAHPIHTEVVANIKSRDELMGFFLSIASLYYMIKFFERERYKYLVMACLLFFSALFAKETAITMLICIPISLFLFVQHNFKKIIFPSLCLSIPVVLFLIIRNNVLSGSKASYVVTPLENLLLSTSKATIQFATEIKIMGEYILLLIFPKDLLYDRSLGQISLVDFSNLGVILTLLFFITMFVYCIIRFLKRDLIAFGIFLFIATMALFSNFIFTIGVAMADRFLYFSSLGFVFILSSLLIRLTKTNQNAINYSTISEFFSKNRNVLLIIIPLSLLYSFRTVERNKDWKDNFTLFSNDLKKMPNSARAHSFYGHELIRTVAINESDSLVKSKIYKESVDELKKSISIYSKQSAEVFASVGTAYLKLNELDSSEVYFKKALKLDPILITNLGDVYFAKGNFKKAIYYYKKQLKMSPKNALAWINLGLSYGTFKQYDLALKHFLKADLLQPNDSQINLFIATVYQFKNDSLNYQKFYQKAVEYSNQ
jgi:tetratricopeptide (TPR) repeat protein